MTTLLQNLRLAARQLIRARAFALTVVATLAIGIGLNAAIFTVVDNVLLRPLGYRDADRIVAIRTHFNDENRSIPRLGGDDYSDLVRQVHGLEAAALYQYWSDGIQLHGVSLYLPVAQVGPRFAEIMGVQPIAGRLFNPADQDGTDVLIGAGFARDHFDSPSAAIGQTITSNGKVYTVAGVLPASFSFPGKTEVWLERPANPRWPNRTSYNDRVLAKRRTGVTPAQLDAELGAFSANLRRQFVEDHNKTIEAVSLQEQIVGRIRPTLRLLMGAVLVVLLIVCANVTHLQLVRATRQIRALTIRTALGATRTALATHALLETSLLTIVGAACAVLLAVPILRLLVRLAPPDVPRLAEVHLNLDVLFFSFLIALVVMVLAALLPVWRSWHLDPAAALRNDTARGTESRGSLRLRNTFIVAEVALTLTLSLAAILLTRQLIAQSHQDLGFAPDSLLTLDTHRIDAIPAPRLMDNTPAGKAAFKAEGDRRDEGRLAALQATLATLAAVPGVQSVDGILGAPMGFGGSDVSYAVKGRHEFKPGALNLPDANLRPTTPGLPATLGLPLLRGRLLNDTDRLGAPPVLLINQELADKVFPGQNPIGQQIMCGYDSEGAWWTIVGVIGNAHEDTSGTPVYPTFYVPVAQHPGGAGDMQLVVRTRIAPEALMQTLTTRLHQAHPELAVKATTMRENIGVMQQSERFRTTLFTLFAAVSILLAAIGMYGVTAYTVAQRRFEFGLRFALGATRAQVLTLVLRNAGAMAAVGIAAGILLSLALTRILATAVGQLPGFDPVAYALAAAAVLAIALVASLLPARRAASVEPMTVLRGE